MDTSSLPFAERIKLKSNSGFDSHVKDRLQELREKAVEKQEKQPFKVGKNMPKLHYSKIPVSVIKHIKGRDAPKKLVVRDPRFENASGQLNQGLFQKSYEFIKDIQNERFQTLKSELK